VRKEFYFKTALFVICFGFGFGLPLFMVFISSLKKKSPTDKRWGKFKKYSLGVKQNHT